MKPNSFLLNLSPKQAEDEINTLENSIEAQQVTKLDFFSPPKPLLTYLTPTHFSPNPNSSHIFFYGSQQLLVTTGKLLPAVRFMIAINVEVLLENLLFCLIQISSLILLYMFFIIFQVHSYSLPLLFLDDVGIFLYLVYFMGAIGLGCYYNKILNYVLSSPLIMRVCIWVLLSSVFVVFGYFLFWYFDNGLLEVLYFKIQDKFWYWFIVLFNFSWKHQPIYIYITFLFSHNFFTSIFLPFFFLANPKPKGRFAISFWRPIKRVKKSNRQ